RKPSRTERFLCPRLEYLERREVLNVPFITRVTPLDGTTPPGTLPALTITFSEDMNQAEVENPANYVLFNSNGKSIRVDSAFYDSSRKVGTLTYNGTVRLPADRYTLFVRADHIHDAHAPPA